MTPLSIGILLIAVFFVFAVLMYTSKLPAVIALPLMAAVLYLVGGVFYHEVSFKYPGSNSVVLLREFVNVVIEEGMPRLWHYMITVFLGAVMASLLKESGVSRAIIRFASELGGDNKMVMCFLLTIATAFLFMTLGGLGAVIMVASVVLPVLLSIGVTPTVAGCVFLFGMSLGGAFNPVNWSLFINILTASGVDTQVAQNQLLSFVQPFAGVFALFTIVFIVLNARRGPTSFWAVSNTADSNNEPAAGGFALLSPAIPIFIMLAFKVPGWIGHYQGYAFPINTALLIGVLYCLFTTGRGPNGYIQKLTKSLFEAFSESAPVAVLIIGIGMVVRVVFDPAVSNYMGPLLKVIIPATPVKFVIVFTVLAPLALYRGPLNVWGMGIAIGTTMISTNVLPPMVIMGALYSVGMIQGVSDPTNTYNAWIAGFLGEDVNSFTRKTLPYTWLLAVIGLIITAICFF